LIFPNKEQYNCDDGDDGDDDDDGKEDRKEPFLYFFSDSIEGYSLEY
jgi:hypothetical protein